MQPAPFAVSIDLAKLIYVRAAGCQQSLELILGRSLQEQCLIRQRGCVHRETFNLRVCNRAGGQRRRIALARALFGDPRLVVLDEPDAGLDGEGERALYHAMQTLRGTGASAIVISHRIALLATVDKLLQLEDGVVRRFGPREAVLADLRQAEPTPTTTPYVIRGGRR